MKSLLETLTRELVDEPDRVFVTERSADGTTLLQLGVAPEDRGYVIGKRGRTVDALRTVLDAVAGRNGGRCRLEIVDHERPLARRADEP